MEPAEIRAHLEALALADAFEREELARLPIDIRLRQLIALFGIHALTGDPADSAAGVEAVRERWMRLRSVLDA